MYKRIGQTWVVNNRTLKTKWR